MMKTSLQFFVSIRIRLVREQAGETQKIVKKCRKYHDFIIART